MPQVKNHPLDTDVRVLTAFDSWEQLKACLSRDSRQYGYTPTLPPTSPAYVRLRRAIRDAGGRVWPKPLIKLTHVTDVQMERLEDFIELSEGCSDRRIQRDAKRAQITRTTVTMTVDLAQDFFGYLEQCQEGAVLDAGFNALSDAGVAFAERAVKQSFAVLRRKVADAINKAI